MNNELMLYSMDCSWAGMIVVIARSEDEARNLMRSCENYDESRQLTVQRIRNGVMVYNLGDL